MSIRNITLCAALALLGLIVSGASAASVTATLNGMPEYRIFDTSLDGGASFHRTSAGELHWTRAPGGEFDAFCIELTQRLGYGKYTYDLLPMENNLLSELWGRDYGKIGDADTAAAFQLAVWEIVYDEPALDLKGGMFRIKGAIESQAYFKTAQSWLGELDGSGPKADLLAMSNPRFQDQVTAAPLPASIWGGLGMLAMTLMVKLRRRAA